MKERRTFRASVLVLGICFLTAFWGGHAFAEGPAVTFGSGEYEVQEDSDFYVGIYLKSDEALGSYRVELKYDKEQLNYKQGADEEQQGVLILEGTSQKKELKYMLTMQSKTSCTTQISVKEVQIEGGPENGQTGTQTQLESAPVVVGDGGDGLPVQEDDPEDVPEEEQELPEGEQQEADTGQEQYPDTDIPLLERITLEGVSYYPADHSSYVPTEIPWPAATIEGSYQGKAVTWLSNDAQDVRLLCLVDAAGESKLYGYSTEKNTLYPCNWMKSGGKIFCCMSPYASESWPQGLSVDIMQRESILFALAQDGTAGFYQMGSGNVLKAWSEEGAVQRLYEQNKKILWIFLIGILIMACSVTVHFLRISVIKRRWRKRRAEYRKRRMLEQAQEEYRGTGQGGPGEWDDETESDLAEPETGILTDEEVVEQPVIAVCDVTMRFRISTANVSGIKEYMIQKLKKQISYRELLALNEVSFCVYPGEVVGIIGTNGSGKSTLLKIISGSLAPTSGCAVADRSKVQLLTLGTGFDTELTARENVYLNGAIIGYTKEYIDEKYDNIVAFAELEGFMEEKVKNFSSGMVSRLGFAIATMRDTPEILILDEVLSVGDMFFRKKSEERIKEMIHGGSTVLIVSHSADVIVKNCTKAVWLEKGVVRKIGKAVEVCEAYKNMASE